MVNWHDWRMNFIPAESWWIFLRCSLRLNFPLKLFPQSKSWQVWTFWSSTISAYFVWLREGLKKTTEKAVRLTAWAPSPEVVRVLWFFQNKLIFWLILPFYNEKNWTKIFTNSFGQAGAGWPPLQSGQPDRFFSFFLQKPGSRNSSARGVPPP